MTLEMYQLIEVLSDLSTSLSGIAFGSILSGIGFIFIGLALCVHFFPIPGSGGSHD